MSFPPRAIATARLDLRPLEPGDAAAVFAYASDPEVVRYVGFPRHESEADTRCYLERAAAGWRGENPMRDYAIVERPSGDRIGSIGYVFEHGAHVGYVLRRASWGQGYASEAASELVRRARAEPSIRRVWAICDTEHLASARVLEKAGLEREGVLRRWAVHPNLSDEPRDCAVFSAVR